VQTGKVRNIIFIVIVACCFFCVIGYKAAGMIFDDIKLPTKSLLEGRSYQTFPELNKETLLDATFQDEFEGYVADLVPKRDRVMLTNAAVQRASIKSASLVFGYKTYPTFYGSNYCYTPSKDAVEEKPEFQSKELSEKLGQSASMFNNVASKYKNINWYVYLPDRSSYSEISNAYGLMSGAVDYSYFKQQFISKLNGQYTFIDGAYNNSAEHDNDFYRTDHHWQVQGAYKAYKEIMSKMGKEVISVDGYSVKCQSEMWGSCTRSGLCLAKEPDEIYDFDYDASSLEVNIDGKEKKMSSLDKTYSKKKYKKTGKFANVYAEWFHGDNGVATITNKKKTGSLLIIGDSYTNNCERLYAESYGTVYKYDSRWTDETLSEFLNTHEVDDVLVLLCGKNYVAENVKNVLK
jgi:hypothetical protein